MDQSTVSVFLALIAIISTVVATTTATNAKTQGMLVQVLRDQIAAGEKREAALIIDNKEQATVIGRLGVSVDKLTDQGAQTIRLLEDVVYGREDSQRRRTT